MSTLKNSDERESTVTDVLLQAITCPEDGDKVLVVDDATGLLTRLDGKGARVHCWNRTGRLGSPWPTGGPYDAITLRLNRNKEAFELSIHACLSVLKAGASLWVYGANDEGMKTIPKRLAWIADCELVDMRRRARVIRLTRPESMPELRGSLSDWVRVRDLDLPSGTRAWKSFPGVFAKGGLDPASASLLEVLPSPPPRSRVLDFASGPGTLSAELQAREPSLQLALLDNDALALEAARTNVPGASYLLSDSWHRPPGRQRWDLILSNPPIHRGKSQDLTVLEDLISGAALRLLPGGSLWIVGLTHLTLGRRLADAFGEDLIELVWTDKRFAVWRASIPS